MRMIKKLRSRRGESFTELLFSVLVMALATALLAASIGTAAGVNAKGMEQQRKLVQELQTAESAQGSAANRTVDVSVNEGSRTESFPVMVYGTTEGLYAYFPEVP